MRTEYKRDMNHNYLILYGEEEINTDSYQVRMLVGNVIPSLLKCRIQGMDGRFLVYFDITSKQALNVLYEEKKMEIEDLRLIFGGFVKAMEDASEYLMNPGQFIIAPEYIYTDIEKQQIYFCMMPGYEKDIREQFQRLTEYILPKIDHQDGEAVILGYGVYKRAMEDSFHLEHIKEELYKVQGTSTLPKEENTEVRTGQKQDFQEFSMEERLQEERLWEAGTVQEEFIREGEATEKPGMIKKGVIIILAALLLCGITAVTLMGYLPYIETGVVMGGILVLAACTMLVVRIVRRGKKPDTLQQRSAEKKGRISIRNSANVKKEEADWKIFEQYPNLTETEKEEKWEKRFYETMKEELESPNRYPDSKPEISKTLQPHADYGETVVLSAGAVSGPASLVSKEPGELATIYLNEDMTVIGKLETACDAVISLPTVSRIHAKIRKREEEYYLTDMNSRNGTAVNGRLLLPDEEYQLQPEDEVDFAQARYIFLA